MVTKHCVLATRFLRRAFLDVHLNLNWLVIPIYRVCLVLSFFVDMTEVTRLETKSILHKDKLLKLHERKRNHPEEIKVIDEFFFSCGKEFLVGIGADGTRVYIGLGDKNGKEVAVKRLFKDHCSHLATQEIEILKSLKSEHVVDCWFFDEKSDKDYSYLIMALCEETLKSFVSRMSSVELKIATLEIARQILKGLADLHRDPSPTLHRDLKPSNILRDVHGCWLLADFGISRVLKTEDSTHRSAQRGTEDWRAVESSCESNSIEGDTVRYKKASDVQVCNNKKRKARVIQVPCMFAW